MPFAFCCCFNVATTTTLWNKITTLQHFYQNEVIVCTKFIYNVLHCFLMDFLPSFEIILNLRRRIYSRKFYFVCPKRLINSYHFHKYTQHNVRFRQGGGRRRSVSFLINLNYIANRSLFDDKITPT